MSVTLLFIILFYFDTVPFGGDIVMTITGKRPVALSTLFLQSLFHRGYLLYVNEYTNIIVIITRWWLNGQRGIRHGQVKSASSASCL